MRFQLPEASTLEEVLRMEKEYGTGNHMVQKTQ